METMCQNINYSDSLMKKERPLLAKNIASLRKARGWTQPELAVATGYSLNTIKELELGKSEGSQNSREKIAAVLGVTVADLFTEPNIKRQAEDKTHIELVSGILALLATLNDSQLGTVKSFIETVKDLPSTELTTADIIRRFFPVLGDEKKQKR